MSKKKSINPIGQLNKGELYLTFLDFQKNKNLLVDTILSHKSISECEDCSWAIAVVGETAIDEIREIEKSCLLKIYIELELLGTAITTLKEKYDFKEDITYKPVTLGFRGMVLVYCAH